MPIQKLLIDRSSMRGDVEKIRDLTEDLGMVDKPSSLNETGPGSVRWSLRTGRAPRWMEDYDLGNSFET